MFTRHGEYEVLGVEKLGVGVGRGRARTDEPGTVEGGAGPRVHLTSHVPAGGTGARDEDPLGEEGVLGHEVASEHLGHGGPTYIAGADHGDAHECGLHGPS